MDTNIRILIVDDFLTMRRVIRTLLGDLGFRSIDEAEDGLAALERLRFGRYDLVISDWCMPHMDGLTLLRTIRNDPSLADLPVLMATAEARKDNVIAAARAGANGYMTKPFSAATLERKIDGILRRSTGLTRRGFDCGFSSAEKNSWVNAALA